MSTDRILKIFYSLYDWFSLSLTKKTRIKGNPKIFIIIKLKSDYDLEYILLSLEFCGN